MLYVCTGLAAAICGNTLLCMAALLAVLHQAGRLASARGKHGPLLCGGPLYEVWRPGKVERVHSDTRQHDMAAADLHHLKVSTGMHSQGHHHSLVHPTNAKQR